MKNNLYSSNTVTRLIKSNKILLIILILAAFIRFYNFPERFTFAPEQAISLLVSSDYINEKFSLLGLPNVQRTTSSGHILYSPAPFNYSLIPLLIIFNYDPVLITSYFAVLNLTTGLVLFIVINKLFSKKTALFTAALFLFNDLMIFHSTFIWIVNYLPLVNIVVGYLFYRFYKQRISKILPFLIGLLLSISFGLEYLYLFTGLILFAILIYFAKNKLIAFLLFTAGAVLGNLPTIIFDLSHDFYHTKTLWQYLLDTLTNPGQSKIAYYHFFQFWPLVALLAGLILSRIFSYSKSAALILLASIICINLLSPHVSLSRPTGMFNNLNFSKIDRAAKIIAADNPANFNVVMTFDFDSRAHPLRYLLKYEYGFKPQGVEDYPKSENLYVLTTKDYPVNNTSLWEISSFKASETKKLGESGEFIIYKLTK